MIQDLTDLKKLLRLCRAQGITEFKMSGLEIKFGDMPDISKNSQNLDISDQHDEKFAGFPDGELTPEQLMFYSSGGLPENDPALKETAV